MAQDYSQIPLVTTSPSTGRFFVPRFWRGGFSPAVSIGVFGILGTVVRLMVDVPIMAGLYALSAFGLGQGLILILSLMVIGAADCAVALWQTVDRKSVV